MPDVGVDTGELFFCFNRNPKHYIVNGHRDPKLDWFTDINFLRAIAHAIDKQGMIDLCFHGLAVPAYGTISPANKLFYDPHLTDYDYDLKKSAELLEAAGYHMVDRRPRRFAWQSDRLQPDDQYRSSGARSDVRDASSRTSRRSASR